MTYLAAPHHTDPDRAREHLEVVLWPQGPICPKCGSFNAKRLEGKAHRKGLLTCRDCRRQFSVTVGTVFERSKVPLNKWLLATYLLSGSKKGMSAHQLHRMLGVTYKTAWFMAHRIREAMRSTDTAPFGSGGGIVEADETFIGRKAGVARDGKRHSIHDMRKVLALVDRETGRARSVVIDGLNISAIAPPVLKTMARDARLATDEAGHYRFIGRHFTDHKTVNHARGEYARGNVHTNTVEGFFSIFKRGMKGVYQHCGEQHLHRYLAEFDFRYSNRVACGFDDTARSVAALQGAVGKRLMYRMRVG